MPYCTTTSGSLFCVSRLTICSIPKFLYGEPLYVDWINFNRNWYYIFFSTTIEHTPHHLDSKSSTSPLHSLKKWTRNGNKNKETINTKHHKGMHPRPGAIFLPTHSITRARASCCQNNGEGGRRRAWSYHFLQNGSTGKIIWGLNRSI